MSKTTKKTGFNGRMRRVRIRLGFESAEAFALASGVGANTYRSWENKDTSPSIAGVKGALKTVRDPLSGNPLRERAALFDWIADGDGDPPSWLNDEHASPWGPEDSERPDGTPPSGPDGLVAMPQRALDVGREAFRILDTARVAGALRDPPAIKAWNVLEGEECFSRDRGTSRSARAA